MIIGLLNQKGGVGKTTLGVHLATAFAQQGKAGNQAISVQKTSNFSSEKRPS